MCPGSILNPAVVPGPAFESFPYSAFPKLFTLIHVKHVGDSAFVSCDKVSDESSGVVYETRKVPSNDNVVFHDDSIHVPNGTIEHIDRQSLKSQGHASGEFVLFPNLPTELQTKIVAIIPTVAKNIHMIEFVDASGGICYGLPNNPGLPSIFKVSKLFHTALLGVKYKLFWSNQRCQIHLGPEDFVVMHSNANGPGILPIGDGAHNCFRARAVRNLVIENWLFSAIVANWENHSLDRLEKLMLVFQDLFFPGLSVRETAHMIIKKAGGVFVPVCDHDGNHDEDNCAIRHFCGRYDDATKLLLDPISGKLTRLVDSLNRCLSRGVHMPAVVVVRFEYVPVRPLLPPPPPPNSPASGPSLGLGI